MTTKKIFNNLQQFEKPDQKQNLLQKRHPQNTRIATESTLDTFRLYLTFKIQPDLKKLLLISCLTFCISITMK